jgi:hypothetical protein
VEMLLPRADMPVLYELVQGVNANDKT